MRTLTLALRSPAMRGVARLRCTVSRFPSGPHRGTAGMHPRGVEGASRRRSGSWLVASAGMDGQHVLLLTDVLHQALVRVDEKGTEAAAATAVVGAGAAPPAGGPIPTVVLDRPFVFLILDEKTRTVLFLGRVMDPRG
jgi:hypothetical protein